MNAIQVVCPHCHRTNRVPPSRLAETPSCGACKLELFGTGPIETNADTMLKHVQNSDLPVLVDCWASWCGPCRMMAPEYHKAADTLDTRAQFLKLDTEQNQSMSAQLNIRSIPCLILFKGGKEVARQAGAMRAEQIQGWLKPFLRA